MVRISIDAADDLATPRKRCRKAVEGRKSYEHFNRQKYQGDLAKAFTGMNGQFHTLSSARHTVPTMVGGSRPAKVGTTLNPGTAGLQHR